MNQKRLRLLFFVCALALTLALPAIARVGGGHSYSGGSSSSGGSHSSGGSYSSGGGSGVGLFYLVELIFRIVFAYPLIGIPLVILIIFLFVKSQKADGDGEVGYPVREPNENRSSQFNQLYQNISNGQAFDTLRLQDPNFSRALFMDFVYSLFAQVHQARGKQQIDDYANYLSIPVLQGLKQNASALQAVNGIVVGSASVIKVKPAASQIEISIEFQANYTEVSANGASQSWFVTEQWTLIRDAKVLSRTPEQAHVLRCPSCGAALSETRNGRCGSCGQRNDHGQFDWLVLYRNERREQREPLLTTTVPEVGTDLPTLFDPTFAEDNEELAATRPDFKWPEYETRVRFIFLELQKAWTQRKWEAARPFESDSLFQMHYYWISAYQRQHLINVLKDVTIERVIPVKISQDKFYSSITVRIYASMLDYTVTESGNKIVAGSSSRARRFSEYWTFIKSHDDGAVHAKTANEQCPSCGAPLKINMSGACEFCKSKITSGQFSWVLSEIEQDEAYAG